MITNRRAFLQGVGASALSASTLASLGTALSGFQAHAADVSGYKALVCVFFLGGLDTHDTLIPYDQTSYDRYAEIRAALLGQYQAMPGGSTRARDRLLALNPDNVADFGGRQFALTEELEGLHALFESGNAAIVGNVGPLIEPLTRAEWEAETALTPKRLFSHNDQQSTWMSSAPEGAMYGWGGRFADAVLAANANGQTDFTTITSLGNELFLTGENSRPYQVGLQGVTEVQALNFFEAGRNTAEGEALYQLVRDHFEAMAFSSSNLIERDIANFARNALETNELFNDALASAPPLSGLFPSSFLGQQLRAVAETIAIRNVLLMNRQVFFVALGGFDTHSRQATDLPALQREFNDAIVSFHAVMDQLGVGQDVTLFTASDFGRTLFINGDGTDHGWGSHHFVIGRAVQGRRIYGDVPVADFNHDQDAGGGRLIPTVSVEQFAEPLGRWFGLSDAEINIALPNLSNFGAPSLAFV